MKGVVVVPQPRAVEAGIEMMEKGGSAIDAAIAAAFAQGVIDPLMTSIGGFGVMYIYDAKSGEETTISFKDMSRYLGDPAFVDVPLARLLSREYAEQCRERIHPEKRMELPAADVSVGARLYSRPLNLSQSSRSSQRKQQTL